SIKVLAVQPLMPGNELGRKRFVFGTCALTAHRPARRLNSVRHDSVLRGLPLDSRSRLDESNDGLMHVERRREVALMHAKFAATIAHHDVPISRQLTRLNALETERSQSREEFTRIARNALERQRQLRVISPTPTKDRGQRLKHFTGPGKNV